MFFIGSYQGNGGTIVGASVLFSGGIVKGLGVLFLPFPQKGRCEAGMGAAYKYAIIRVIEAKGVSAMIHEASAMEVRNNLGELLNEVQYRHDTILIKKAGKAVAAMVDIVLFEKICRMREVFETLTQQLGKAYLPEEREIAEQEIAEAIAKARKE